MSGGETIEKKKDFRLPSPVDVDFTVNEQGYLLKHLYSLKKCLTQ